MNQSESAPSTFQFRRSSVTFPTASSLVLIRSLSIDIGYNTWVTCSRRIRNNKKCENGKKEQKKMAFYTYYTYCQHVAQGVTFNAILAQIKCKCRIKIQLIYTLYRTLLRFGLVSFIEESLPIYRIVILFLYIIQIVLSLFTSVFINIYGCRKIPVFLDYYKYYILQTIDF